MLPPRVVRAFRLAVRSRAHLAADVDEEVAFHLAERIAQLERQGLSPEAARAEAIRRFGPAHLTRVRDGRGWTWRAAHALHTTAQRREDRMRIREGLDRLVDDLRHGWRALRRAPGFTTVIALTLALGLGANVSIFSVINAVLLRPLPYPAPERLVVLGDGQSGTEVVPASYPEFVDWRERGAAAFSVVGAYFTNEAALTGAGEPDVLRGVRASAGVHHLLGTAVLRGRALVAADDARGSERVVMVSERLWRVRFGADPTLVGRALTINDYPWTVVGILRDDARAVLPAGLVTGEGTDVWFPLRLDEAAAPRGLHFLTVLAQRRPDVPLEGARRHMATVAAELQGTGVTEHGIAVLPAAERLVGDVRERLVLLLGAVGLVLLIGCANVANLLLARAAAREREVAVQLAIGASRSRVVTRLLIESMLRALLGGVLGLAVALVATAGIRRLLLGHLPRAAEVTIDGTVVLVGVALSVLTGVLFGLLPAVRAARHDPAQIIREGGRGLSAGPRGDRLRSTLVVAEVALSFVLLVGAGLLLRSFGRLTAVDRGFDARQTITALVTLPGTRYADSTRQIAFFDALQERVAALPGVRGVALASNLPVEGGTNGQFQIEGRPFPPDDQPLAEKRVVSRDYFAVLGARVVAGRAFDARDVLGAPGAMVINESFARRWFPGRSAVGQRVAFAWGTEGMQTIVGVVADIREGPLDRPAPPAMYVPVTQRPADALFLLVRTAGAPEPLVPAIRRTVLTLDAALPVANVRTMDAILARGMAKPRLSAALVSALAVLAVGLAAVGLYGVITYVVVQRTREFGIRSALGARPADVIRLVMRQSGALVLGGLTLGVLLTLPLTRLLQSQLFAVHAADPLTLATVTLLLGAVGVAAAAGPAWRATRIQPVVALRQD